MELKATVGLCLTVAFLGSNLHNVETASTSYQLRELKKGQLSLKIKMDSLKRLTDTKLSWLRRDIDKLKKPKDMIVFSAYMDSNLGSPVDTTVVFNKILINEASAYNPSTGIFTSPKTGLYDFSFAIGQSHDNEARAELRVNNKVYVAAAADAEHPNQDVQGGNRAFVRLNKGDTVKVVKPYGQGNIEGEINRSTTFSGMLVSE